MTQAVILVPVGSDDERAGWLDACLRHCIARSYNVVSYAAVWDDAAYMLLNEGAEVVVAARWDHFPPDRVPRIEAAGTPPPAAGQLPRERRARDIGQYPQ